MSAESKIQVGSVVVVLLHNKVGLVVEWDVDAPGQEGWKVYHRPATRQSDAANSRPYRTYAEGELEWLCDAFGAVTLPGKKITTAGGETLPQARPLKGNDAPPDCQDFIALRRGKDGFWVEANVSAMSGAADPAKLAAERGFTHWIPAPAVPALTPAEKAEAAWQTWKDDPANRAMKSCLDWKFERRLRAAYMAGLAGLSTWQGEDGGD